MAANVAKLPDCQLELRQVPTRNNWNDASLLLVIQQCTILLTRDEARRIAANVAKLPECARSKNRLPRYK